MTISIWDKYTASHIYDSEIIWSGPNSNSLPLDCPIHIITAYNPFDQIFSFYENRCRNELLLVDIKNHSAEIKPVIVSSPNHDWQDESFAVHGISREQACDLAQSYDQRAIFELNHNQLIVVAVNSYQVKRSRPRNIE
ncbi:MAG: DUF3293 domain-containing protein [Gammaproteobacteria bacterium]|nr:DUF3293 domain-containing protein [Gammaproteobacteria bacterium]